jgi:DNA-binding transcriptional MerR regulator
MADTQKEKKSTTKITCILTGKATALTRDYYNKKIEEFGSEESLHQKYICKQAKSMVKRGYSIEEIQDVLGKPSESMLLTLEQIKQIVSEKDSDNFSSEHPLERVNTEVKQHVKVFMENLQNYNG